MRKLTQSKMKYSMVNITFTLHKKSDYPESFALVGGWRYFKINTSAPFLVFDRKKWHRIVGNSENLYKFASS